MSTIGERILLLRKEKKITQKDFSERVCVTQSYISRVEQNKENPTDMLLKLISLEFGVSFWWLKDGEAEAEITKKDVDYFERNQLEDYHSNVITKLVELSEQIKETNPSELDVLLNALLVQMEILFKDINDNKIKVLIFDNFVNIITSYTELVSNLIALDKKDKSHENKIFYNVRLITGDIEEGLIEQGNHFCERNK